MSRQIEAHRILACSGDVLDPAQRDALDAWLRGDEVAAGAAARLVRSAVARLRYRFAAEGSVTRAARRTGSKKIDRSV